MMTKQEFIKQAYGQRWEQIKDLVDENGWVKDAWIAHGVSNGVGYDELEQPYASYQVNFKSFGGSDSTWRLKTLHNIENNNGWTDTSTPPKESGRYWCYVQEQNDLGLSHFQWNCCYDAKENLWSDNCKSMSVTHWQELSNNPLY